MLRQNRSKYCALSFILFRNAVTIVVCVVGGVDVGIRDQFLKKRDNLDT